MTTGLSNAEPSVTRGIALNNAHGSDDNELTSSVAADGESQFCLSTCVSLGEHDLWLTMACMYDMSTASSSLHATNWYDDYGLCSQFSKTSIASASRSHLLEDDDESDKQVNSVRVTPSTLQAYVAMRGGVNGVEFDEKEPLLAYLGKNHKFM